MLTRGALCSVPGTLMFGLIIAYTLEPFGAAMAFAAAVFGLLITDHTFRRLVSSANVTKSAATQNARRYPWRRTPSDVMPGPGQDASAQHHTAVDPSTEVTHGFAADTNRQQRQTY